MTKLLIGHRGAPVEAPENTMASFERALALGADGFEFDVQLTSDGHPVVVHDAMLDRTTNGSGPVFDATLEEVRSLDAGSWFGADFAGAQVPLLDEVLALPAAVFELETKAWGREAIDAVLAAVDRAGVMDRVKFTGWSHTMLGRIKAERPEASIGLFAKRPESWMTEAVFERYILGTAETAGFDVAHVYAAAITEPIVTGLRDLGYVVHANDAADRHEMQLAIHADADSFCLNDVALGLSMLGRT